MNTAAYMACYQQLKRVMIATLEQGYAKAAPEKQRRDTDLILNNNKWLEVLLHIKRYASMLEDTGNLINIDNINKGIKPCLSIKLISLCTDFLFFSFFSMKYLIYLIYLEISIN